MSDLSLKPVPGADAALQSALEAAHLPTDDLAEAGRAFYKAEHHATARRCPSSVRNTPGQLVGFGGLELYGDCALLRSVVVVADQRGRGFGQAITRQLLDQAHRDGAGAVYLLTDTAAPFFQNLGYTPIDRAAAPAAILHTRQAASLCPASAALMVAHLPE